MTINATQRRVSRIPIRQRIILALVRWMKFLEKLVFSLWIGFLAANVAILASVRRLRIFGQRDKLRADRSKRGVRSGCKEKAAQRGFQSASGDGGAFWGEDPG